MKHTVLTLCAALAAASGMAQEACAIDVLSPNGQIALTIDVQEGKAVYSVAKNGYSIITPSQLGVCYGTQQHYAFVGLEAAQPDTVNSTYTLNHGKRSTYTNHYVEQRVTFEGAEGGGDLTMVFRVYDDGVAFRYTKAEGGSDIRWSGELSEFNFNSFRKCWVQEKYDAGYSAYFVPKNWNELAKSTYAGNEYGYCVPMLVKTSKSDSWCLITESAALSSIAASTLVKGATNGLRLEIVEHGNKVGSTAIPSTFSTPFESPWRTLIIGSLAQIVESTLTQNLSPETLEGDWDWVKPGRVAWNWAAEGGSNDLTSTMCRRYTDMAAYFGWEYNLLDEGWSGRLNVQSEVDYASRKGVGLILWFNQNHFGNDYNSIYTEMKKWADRGVVGFKIDFFEDDRQQQLQKYEYMLEAARQLKLVINFHGCTKPSGLDRTWPNLLTMEANFGGEMYMFWPHFTPAYHVVNLCLTRNVLGSMDYTPLKWGTHKGSIRSIGNNTWAQQLAMIAAFETGQFHPSDTPENLMYSVADPLLRRLPVAWDDTRCLEALPDQYVTLARRKGHEWWVSTLANDARTASISTDYLDEGTSYYAHIYRDGNYRYEVWSEVRHGITRGTKLTLPVLQYGGALVVLTPDSAMAFPHDRTYEAEYYNHGGTIEADSRVFAGHYVSGLNATNTLKFTDIVAHHDGQYAVTLYYRADSPTKAYVQANDEPKVQISMEQPGVSDRDHPGENIGFHTALVDLKQGVNTITIGNNKGGNAPMVDHITVRPTSFPPAQPSELMSADGKTYLHAITVEGESGRGDGAVYSDTRCSGGKRLNDLTRGKVRTYTVDVARAGIYDFHIYYMTAADRSIVVTTPDREVRISTPSTGAWDGASIRYATLSVHLDAGTNTFALGNPTDHAPNVDRIEIVLAVPDAEDNGITASTARATSVWTTLGGIPLRSIPTEAGVYIYEGKKIMVE